MTVNEVYNLVLYCVAKNSSMGYVSPEDFNEAINTAQFGYVDYLLGQYQQYLQKRPIPVVAFGENERVRTSLAPLIYETVIPINNVTGIANYPYGFLQVDAMWGQYGYYNIRFTEQDRLSSNIRSVIDTPTTTNPVYIIRHEGFQFFPFDTGSARISYVTNPPYITWGYNLDANGIHEYDATKSSQPVWADTDMLSIVVRALQIIGVNLQFRDVMQYSEQIKKQGQ